MDADTKRRIRETAVKILQAAKEMQTHSDVDSQKAGDLMMTEDGLCATVSGSLGLDLSSDFQLLVRDVMKSNDLPNQAEGDEEDADFANLLEEELEKQSAKADSTDDVFARRGHRLLGDEEDGLCATVSGSLGLDLSSDFQLLVRDVMKSNDLPNQAEGDEEDADFANLLEEELEKQSAMADSTDDVFARRGHRLLGDEEDEDFTKLFDDIFARRGHHLICRLAANKLATVTKYKGQRMVSLRKWYPINGKLEPCKAGIHLKVDEWIKLRDAMNDVDQLIATMQNAKPGGC